MAMGEERKLNGGGRRKETERRREKKGNWTEEREREGERESNIHNKERVSMLIRRESCHRRSSPY
jgi:hypothetical protein